MIKIPSAAKGVVDYVRKNDYIILVDIALSDYLAELLGDGDFCYLRITRTPNEREVVKVIGVFGSELSVIRAQEFTEALEFLPGDSIEYFDSVEAAKLLIKPEIDESFNVYIDYVSTGSFESVWFAPYYIEVEGSVYTIQDTFQYLEGGGHMSIQGAFPTLTLSRTFDNTGCCSATTVSGIPEPPPA